MALYHGSDPKHGDSDNFGADVYERDTGRSNFTSFVIGGVVVAGGLLAFLFYDGGQIGGRDMSTAPSTQSQAPAAPAVPSTNTPAGPSAPTGQ